MPTEWSVAIVLIGLLAALNAWTTLRLYSALGARARPKAGSPSGAVRESTDVVAGRPVSELVPHEAPLIAVFMSEGCHYCHRLMPQLNAFADEQQHAAVVGVIAGSREDARRLALARGLTVPVIAGTDIEHAVPFTPYAVVFDHDDTILAERGVSSRRDLQTLAQSARVTTATPPATQPFIRPAPRASRRPRRTRSRSQRRQVAAFTQLLGAHRLDHPATVQVVGSRRSRTIKVGPDGRPAATLTIAQDSLHELLDGELFAPAALLRGAITVHGSFAGACELLHATHAIGSSAKLGVDPRAHRPALPAAMRARGLSGEPTERRLLAAAMLAAGPPLARLLRIAELNEAYLSSRISASDYRELTEGLLDLAATNFPTSPSTPVLSQEVTHAR